MPKRKYVPYLPPVKNLHPTDEMDALNTYLNEIHHLHHPSAEEEQALMVRVKAGDKDAKEEMVTRNLALVVSLAKRFLGQGLAYLDLIQEGNLGLMKAVERFKPELGYKFSTYATWWIVQAIQRGIVDRGRAIRLPVYVSDTLVKARRAEDRVWQGEAPQQASIPEGRLQRAQEAPAVTFSLNQRQDDAQDVEYLDLLPDLEATPEQTVDNQAREEVIKCLLAQYLSPREVRILELRYGFNGASDCTLEQVAKQVGITRERVRQIEKVALEKLRNAALPLLRELAS